jgi:hypothetical protein
VLHPEEETQTRMGFSLVTSFPAICNIKCCCYKCGIKAFPDLLKVRLYYIMRFLNPSIKLFFKTYYYLRYCYYYQEWWCEGVCCCNFNNCGLVELCTFQYFIFGPCSLTAPALNCNFKVPVSDLGIGVIYIYIYVYIHTCISHLSIHINSQ